MGAITILVAAQCLTLLAAKYLKGHEALQQLADNLGDKGIRQVKKNASVFAREGMVTSFFLLLAFPFAGYSLKNWETFWVRIYMPLIFTLWQTTFATAWVKVLASLSKQLVYQYCYTFFGADPQGKEVTLFSFEYDEDDATEEDGAKQSKLLPEIRRRESAASKLYQLHEPLIKRTKTEPRADTLPILDSTASSGTGLTDPNQAPGRKYWLKAIVAHHQMDKFLEDAWLAAWPCISLCLLNYVYIAYLALLVSLLIANDHMGDADGSWKHVAGFAVFIAVYTLVRAHQMLGPLAAVTSKCQSVRSGSHSIPNFTTRIIEEYMMNSGSGAPIELLMFQKHLERTPAGAQIPVLGTISYKFISSNAIRLGQVLPSVYAVALGFFAIKAHIENLNKCPSTVQSSNVPQI